MTNKKPPVIFLETIDSTNLFAQELLRDHKVAHGTTIAARHQLAGRGQRGNEWHSMPGENLTFSMIFLPERYHVSGHFSLNMVFSLAIRDFLYQIGVSNVNVKWPNDIYVDGRKIAGILVENAIRGENISYIIAGIGLNLNQLIFDREYSQLPISVKLLTGKEMQVQECLDQLSELLLVRFNQLCEGRYPSLHNDYLAALYRLNQVSTFRTNDQTWNGIIRNVTQDGMLIIQAEDGLEKPYSLAEIKMTG